MGSLRVGRFVRVERGSEFPENELIGLIGKIVCLYVEPDTWRIRFEGVAGHPRGLEATCAGVNLEPVVLTCTRPSCARPNDLDAKCCWWCGQVFGV